MKNKITSVILMVILICSLTLGVYAAETAIRPDTSEPESIVVSNQQCEKGAITFEYSSDKLEVGDDLTVMFYKPVGPEDGIKDCIMYKADGELTTADLSNIYYIDQFEVKADKKITFPVPDGIEEGTYNLMIGGTDINSPTVATVTVEKLYMLGDVTEDGRILTNDAQMILKHIAKIKIIEEKTSSFYAADVDKNGRILTNDATKILKYIAKLINSLE